MPAVNAPVCLCCVLFSVAFSLDFQLAYITHSSLYFYSCAGDHELQPCAVSSLCRCAHLHSSPALQVPQLVVWYTSASNAARALNNSEVKHLTLIRCGQGGSKGDGGPGLEDYFAVLHLERLTVVTLNRKPIVEARNTELETENGADLNALNYNRVTDLNAELRKDLADLLPSPRIQEVFMGREFGAEYQEQARLGVVYGSVFEPGTGVKAYTVLTHIDRDGLLPFPELRLPRLQETSTVYVSFVY